MANDAEAQWNWFQFYKAKLKNLLKLPDKNYLWHHHKGKIYLNKMISFLRNKGTLLVALNLMKIPSEFPFNYDIQWGTLDSTIHKGITLFFQQKIVPHIQFVSHNWWIWNYVLATWEAFLISRGIIRFGVVSFWKTYMS